MSESKAAAWQVSKKGLPPVTLEKEVVDVPEPRKGEVLVEVHASALNPVDWKLAAHAPSFIQAFPRTLASDFAGVVLAHGEGISESQKQSIPVGSRVFGIVGADEVVRGQRDGTLATHVRVLADQVAQLPGDASSGYTFQEGACLPLTGLTAYAMQKQAKQGDKVLVLGGSTSVGLLLLQMLRHKGVQSITTTASGEKQKTVKEKGATEVIDHRASNVVEELTKGHGQAEQQFDLILDAVGDIPIYRASPAFLKSDGLYFNIGASSLSPSMSAGELFGFFRDMTAIFLPWWLGGVNRRAKQSGLDRADFPAFAREYVEGAADARLRPVIDSEFAFDDAKKAYERLMEGRALGKVVVVVKHD